MRAITSVSSNPVCPSKEAAEQAVNEVWDSCFKDTRPFDEVSYMLLWPMLLHRVRGSPPVNQIY